MQAAALKDKIALHFPLLSVALVLSSFLGAPTEAAKPAAAIDGAALSNVESRHGEWLTHGRDYAETRYSPLDQITADNVKDLGLAWSFSTDTQRGLEATPLIVDGVMYTTGAWSIVFAVDARTGRELWKYDPGVPPEYGGKACCDVVNRGVAIYQGKVFVGTLDGRLVALDSESGTPVWETVTVDQSKPYTITGAPRVVSGNVIIGNGGAEFGVRGYISAYDVQTGKLSWRFYTVPGDPSKPFESPAMEAAAETWTGEWWKIGGGGTVWDSFSYDPELDLLYVGVGNGSPWSPQLRSEDGGDNLYLSCICALRGATGELVWHYQTTPGDAWDYTATQHIILTEMDIKGRRRKVLMQAPKNGFFYILDRETGELLSAEAYVPVNWAQGIDMQTGRPIENPGVRYEDGGVLQRPGPLGGHNWQPMSYSPRTGLVYIPARDAQFYYALDKDFKYRPGTWNTGMDFAAVPGVAPDLPVGYLLAWDPVAQKERWRVPHLSIWNGGTLATAGDLVFQGTAEGRFIAYHAERGTKLWDVNVGSGIIGSPVTYELDGRQYVSIMAGWGGAGALIGAFPVQTTQPSGRLFTFALSGKQTLPEPTAVAAAPPEVDPIESDATLEVITAGAVGFTRTCGVCHGLGAMGTGGAISDLRLSDPSVFDSYHEIVLEGELVEMGMPNFKLWLKPAEVDAIREYVISQRNALAKLLSQ